MAVLIRAATGSASAPQVTASGSSENEAATAVITGPIMGLIAFAAAVRGIL